MDGWSPGKTERAAVNLCPFVGMDLNPCVANGGKIPPEHSLLCNFFVWRDLKEIFYDCAQINSLQDSIDFMTLASRDLSRHDVIFATLVKFI